MRFSCRWRAKLKYQSVSNLRIEIICPVSRFGLTGLIVLIGQIVWTNGLRLRSDSDDHYTENRRGGDLEDDARTCDSDSQEPFSKLETVSSA